ncbi:hypothetical protein ScPMuIL_014017 [Solemya velum]
MASTGGRLYMLTIKIPTSDGNFPLSRSMPFIIKDVFKKVPYVHKFKVLGEPRILAVLNVPNNAFLEKVTSRLSDIGIFDVICEPLLEYEKFAQRLGVDEALTTAPSQHVLNDPFLYWLQVDVDT